MKNRKIKTGGAGFLALVLLLAGLKLPRAYAALPIDLTKKGTVEFQLAQNVYQNQDPSGTGQAGQSMEFNDELKELPLHISLYQVATVGENGAYTATAEYEALPLAKMAVSAHRAFAGHPAQRRLGHDHGVAEGEGEDDVDEQEDAAAVLGRKIGKAPDVAEAHRRACSGENESDLARKGAPLVLFLIHWIFLFSQIQYPQCITAGEGIQPVFR